MASEISIKLLKQHAIEFPEPLRGLIQQEPEFMDSDRLINDLGTFEKLLKLREVKS